MKKAFKCRQAEGRVKEDNSTITKTILLLAPDPWGVLFQQRLEA